MIPAVNSAYSADELLALKRWLEAGLTANAIAKAFGEQFSRAVSRNAIIGVVHRHPELSAIGFGGLPVAPARPRPPRAAPPRRIPDTGYRPPMPVQVDTKSPFVYDATSRHLELVALSRRDCRFPVNEAAPGEAHFFCGHPAAPDSPYCRHHSMRAFSGTARRA